VQLLIIGAGSKSLSAAGEWCPLSLDQVLARQERGALRVLVEGTAAVLLIARARLISHSSQLRKHIRTKRLEDVRQLGMDRVVDFTFGAGSVQCHLIMELYAAVGV
jgi:hypothetical protein